MIAVVVSDGFFVVALVATVLVTFPGVAILDAFAHPKDEFAVTRLSRRTWLALLIGLTLATVVLGFLLSIYYLKRVRPELQDHSPMVRRIPVGLRFVVITLFVFTVYGTQYGFSVATSRSSGSQLASIVGHLRGSCGSHGPSSNGRRVSVVLTHLRTSSVLQRTSIGGDTGQTTFAFDVGPGNYRLTATSSGETHHWELSYIRSTAGAPPATSVPIAMNVPIAAVC